MLITRRGLGMLSAGMAVGAAGPEGFPSRTVRIVVPYPPGGTTDLVARLVAGRLTERLGRSVIVENKAGASGVIGTEAVARAAPDGYSLLFGTINTHGINSAVLKSLPYDPVADFAGVSQVISSPNVLLANPTAGLNTLDDVLRRARASPGQLAFGSTGNGGSPHMSGVLLQTMAGITLEHVPYKGGGPMLSDLMAGHVTIGFDNLPSSMGQIRSGAVRAIAVTTGARAATAPDVPAIAETVAGYDVSAWFGLLAPRRTPDAIVRYLSDEVAGVLREPETSRRLADTGALPIGNSPAAFDAAIVAEVEKWRRVVAVMPVTVD